MGYLIIQTRGPSPLFLPTLFNTLNRITGGIKKRKNDDYQTRSYFFKNPKTFTLGAKCDEKSKLEKSSDMIGSHRGHLGRVKVS
jgi:hypothetical protein